MSSFIKLKLIDKFRLSSCHLHQILPKFSICPSMPTIANHVLLTNRNRASHERRRTSRNRNHSSKVVQGFLNFTENYSLFQILVALHGPHRNPVLVHRLLHRTDKLVQNHLLRTNPIHQVSGMNKIRKKKEKIEPNSIKKNIFVL